jgi:hypothetical protein
MTFKKIMDELNEIEENDFYSITYDGLTELKNKIEELEEIAITLNEMNENDSELAEIFNKIEELNYIIEETELIRYEDEDEEDYY